MGSWRRLGSTAVATTFAMALAAPVYAQTAAYSAAPTPGGHYHEGEIGEKLLMVEHALRCNCSCGLDVHSCQFQMQCGTSPGWTQRIMTQLQAGESEDAILAGFVADFGGTVLMSPPPEGFNLVGYFLPAVAIVTAGMLIGMFAKGRPGLRPAPVSDLDLADEDAERLRAELRHLDETEGPDW